MYTLRNLALAFASLAAAAGVASAADAAAADKAEPIVKSLTKDTFKDFIKEHDLVLAEFFAPWCGHCKSLAPEYETAAGELADKNIPLVKVDCTEEMDLCREFGVQGYPTLKVFRGLDNVKPYGDARKAPRRHFGGVTRACMDIDTGSDGHAMNPGDVCLLEGVAGVGVAAIRLGGCVWG
ncbi:protein disulfide-isomerase precursor [Ascosphaera pollenicola]|nr:protein disulfide-isomerase precursor [Ascosphaera pollenicola]